MDFNNVSRNLLGFRLTVGNPIELTGEILNQIAQWDDDNNRYLIGGLWEIRIVNNRIVHGTIFLPSLGSLQHLMKLYEVEINFNEK